MLKNVKRQLLNSHVFSLSDATVSEHQLPSKEVKVEHVHAVLQYDKERELKVAPKLSEAHVSTGHFTGMKVGIAVQFFREAPSAIRYLINFGARRRNHRVVSGAHFEMVHVDVFTASVSSVESSRCD